MSGRSVVVSNSDMLLRIVLVLPSHWMRLATITSVEYAARSTTARAVIVPSFVPVLKVRPSMLSVVPS